MIWRVGTREFLGLWSLPSHNPIHERELSADKTDETDFFLNRSLPRPMLSSFFFFDHNFNGRDRARLSFIFDKQCRCALKRRNRACQHRNYFDIISP
jgi:hypothetical protein